MLAKKEFFQSAGIHADVLSCPKNRVQQEIYRKDMLALVFFTTEKIAHGP